MRISLSAAAGAILAVGICWSASAAKLPVLRDTIVHTGDGNGSALPVGNDTIDTATVNCADKFGHGCQLILNTTVEMAAGDALWAICPTVDGVAMNPACPVQDVTQASGASTVTGSGWSNLLLTQGSHTVSVVLMIHHASSLYSWQASYFNWSIPR